MTDLSAQARTRVKKRLGASARNFASSPDEDYLSADESLLLKMAGQIEKLRADLGAALERVRELENLILDYDRWSTLKSRKMAEEAERIRERGG